MPLLVGEKRVILARLVTTVLGTGFCPIAPGTFASLLALPVAWAVLQTPGWAGPLLLSLIALLGFSVGIWATGRYAADAGRDDPVEAVIDEFSGQCLALIPAAPNAVWQFAAGFALFRAFDILKPWPIDWAQREFRAGWGIMMDDAIAAVYSAAALALAIHVSSAG
jgi:phosphatidylglycerophosphatase A